MQQHNKTQRYLKKCEIDSVFARVRFDCSQLKPLSLCGCRAALCDHSTAGSISSYRITVTNVSLQRNARWSQYLCAILTFNKRAGHSEHCKSMWFYPPPMKPYWTEQLVTSNLLPTVFLLFSVSTTSVSPMLAFNLFFVVPQSSLCDRYHVCISDIMGRRSAALRDWHFNCYPHALFTARLNV